jgi:hypothetical protein
MNYKKIYTNIIENAKKQNRNKITDYYEKHHIIPSSLLGTNNPDNLVLLTAREHFICHWLLYKFTKGSDKYKMGHALFRMSNISRGQDRIKIHARKYEIIKKIHAKSASFFHKGKKISEDILKTRTKNPPNATKIIIENTSFISITEASNYYNVLPKMIRDYIKGDITLEYLTDKEYRKNIRIEKQKLSLKAHYDKMGKRDYETLYGKEKSDKLKELKRQQKLGTKLSEETKEKIAKSKRGKPSWNKGKPMNNSTKMKLSEARKGKHISKNDYIVIDHKGERYEVIREGIRNWFRRNYNSNFGTALKTSLHSGNIVKQGKWKGWSIHVL